MVELEGNGIVQYIGVDDRIIVQSVLKNGLKDLAWASGQEKAFVKTVLNRHVLSFWLRNEHAFKNDCATWGCDLAAPSIARQDS
jgi:hypothetical protein